MLDLHIRRGDSPNRAGAHPGHVTVTQKPDLYLFGLGHLLCVISQIFTFEGGIEPAKLGTHLFWAEI